jgi:hypothetical protein
MKVEGMQYPLSVKPIGARNGNSNQHKDMSEDAVYFEPEERREQKKNQKEDPEEKQQPLELQVERESVSPAKEEASVEPAQTVTKERPALNIVV